MRKYTSAAKAELRVAWLAMVVPPWLDSGDRRVRTAHWVWWFVGWVWTLAGLTSGALVAPSLIRVLGLAHTTYEDWLVIALAVLAGFLVQMLGWSLISFLTLVLANNLPIDVFSRYKTRTQTLIAFLSLCAVILLPLVGVGFGIYVYLARISADQRTVTIAFLGALLIKTLITLFKGIVTRVALKLFLRRLRRDSKRTSKPA
jgi:hypothetical protein